MNSAAPARTGEHAQEPETFRLAEAVAELSASIARGRNSPVLSRLVERIAGLVDELVSESGESVASRARPVLPRLDHLGAAVSDLGEASKLFVEFLGGELVGGGSESVSQLRSLHVAFAGGGKIELLEPLSDNPLKRFLEKRGQGPHHLAFVVNGLVDIVARLNAAGYRVVDDDLVNSDWKEAYVSPRSASGCLVQLVETGPSFGRPTAGVTVEDVLADRWMWEGREPRRRAPEVQSGE